MNFIVHKEKALKKNRFPSLIESETETQKEYHEEQVEHKHKKDRILFLLKNNAYQDGTNTSGLYNSSKMLADYLEKLGKECKIVTVDYQEQVYDEVYNFKPSIVIIEALWIDGMEMEKLILKFKDIKWVVRIHSNIGFLASEPFAFKYIQDYLHLNHNNIIISCNNKRFNQELSRVCNHKFKYLPDVVTFEDTENLLESSVCEDFHRSLTESEEELTHHHHPHEVLDIGCFGALRVLKNQMFQAMCSITAADRLNKTLHFHINDDKDKYNPVLSNLKKLFEINDKHKLIIHEWLDQEHFNKLIHEMDLGLQLSYTESFNMITANFVINEVPIIVSDSIDWMPRYTMISDVDFGRTTHEIMTFNRSKLAMKVNKFYLLKYNHEAKEIWRELTKKSQD